MSELTIFKKLEPYGYPLIRAITGLILMPHGAQKLFGWFGGYGLEGTGQYFAGTLGMEPGFFWALVAGLIEFFGGLALLIGFLTRPAALAVSVFLAVAVTFHLGQGYFWTNGGYEYPLLWAVVAFGIFLRGPDNLSVDSKLNLPF